MLKLAAETHVINDRQGRRRVTTVELLLRAVVAKAASGDIGAEKCLDSIRDRLAPSNTGGGGFMLAPETLTPGEFVRQCEIIGRFAVRPGTE